MNPSDNNSFGMQNIPDGQVSGGQAVPAMQATQPKDTGDIVLAASGKKAKKWPFVVLGLVVFAALAAMGAWMMTRGGGEEETIRGKFNVYANYILYGEESNNELTSTYDAENSYKIEDILNDSGIEEQRSYFAKVTEYWKNFVDDYNTSTDTGDADNLEYVVDTYINLSVKNLEFLTQYVNLEKLSAEMIMTMYLANGKEYVENYIAQQYKNFIDSENSLMQEYAGYEMEYLQITIDQMEMLENAGCVTNGTIDDECANSDSVGFGDEYWATHENPLYLLRYEKNMINSSANAIVQYCFVISDELKNMTVYSDGEDNEE